MKFLLFTFSCLLVMTLTAHAQTMAAADSLAAYVGTYTFSQGDPISKFTVTVEKGELFGEADSYGRNKLIRQPGADTFQSTSSYGSIITFIRDATTKVVTKLTLAAQGAELSAKKENP